MKILFLLLILISCGKKDETGLSQIRAHYLAKESENLLTNKTCDEKIEIISNFSIQELIDDYNRTIKWTFNPPPIGPIASPSGNEKSVPKQHFRENSIAEFDQISFWEKYILTFKNKVVTIVDKDLQVIDAIEFKDKVTGIAVKSNVLIVELNNKKNILFYDLLEKIILKELSIKNNYSAKVRFDDQKMYLIEYTPLKLIPEEYLSHYKYAENKDHYKDPESLKLFFDQKVEHYKKHVHNIVKDKINCSEKLMMRASYPRFLTNLTTINLSNMREQKAFDILSQAPSAIYMNSKNLFIIDPIRQYNKSNIYQIPLEKIDSWPATLQVTGHLNNQFDIDQYENYLRVGSHNWESDDNLLSILDLSTGATLATIEELGVNEDIYSMEFTDTKVIMVTYRVYDPFYVIDVNDHERPILTTTIKQPGFNSYLKVFNDKVIGLGQMGRWFGNSKLDLFSLPEVQASEKLFSQEFEGYINVHQTNYEASYKSIYLNQDKKHVAFMVHGYNYHSGSYSNKIHFYEINETAVEYKTINLEENGLNLRMFDHEGYFYIITQNSIKKYDPSSYEKISSTNL